MLVIILIMGVVLLIKDVLKKNTLLYCFGCANAVLCTLERSKEPIKTFTPLNYKSPDPRLLTGKTFPRIFSGYYPESFPGYYPVSFTVKRKGDTTRKNLSPYLFGIRRGGDYPRKERG